MVAVGVGVRLPVVGAVLDGPLGVLLGLVGGALLGGRDVAGAGRLGAPLYVLDCRAGVWDAASLGAGRTTK